jgi:hypothetical protein
MKTLTCEICSTSVDYEPRPGLTSVPCWYCPNPVEIPAEEVVHLARPTSAPPPPRAKDCPSCGLANTSHAATCDRGSGFGPARHPPSGAKAGSRLVAVVGGVLAVCALVRLSALVFRLLFTAE